MEDNKNMYEPETSGEPQPTAFPDPAETAEPWTETPQPDDFMIPRQAETPQAGNTFSEGTTQEMPEQPRQTQTESAFYGDPTAPVHTPPPQYYYTPDPAPTPQPVPVMNRRIYTMAAVIAVLIFLLCIFCIGSDLLKGVLGSDTVNNSGGASGSGTEVVIKTQSKPNLDPDDENVTEDGEYTVRGVAELVKPSIVEVFAYDSGRRTEDYLNGTGSGIIISEDGYIITNAHVVQGEAFTVILDDETEYEAAVVGSDTKTDLAVLKIDAEDLPVAVLGDSDEVYVGENVVAIGNPAGLTGTVTQGIVSAVNRQIRTESTAFVMNCIQTDAAISPGNSGGALVNMYGQVIGITSSKYASSYLEGNAYEGLGFAITVNQALPIVEELISQGYVSGRFRIGITFMETDTEYAKYYYETEFGTEMPDEVSGLWVSEISEDCDIANTELQADDFILSMNGTPVKSYDDVREVLDGFEGGDMVTAGCARVEEDGSITYFNIEFMLEEDTSGNY